MRNDQQGFAFHFIILAILILGTIGFVGWRTWDRNPKPAEVSSASPTSQKDRDTTSEATVPSDWVEHKYTKLGINLRAPKDWQIEQLSTVSQINLSAPRTITAKTVDAPSETFRFSFNIASPSRNDPSKVLSEAYIFSSTPLTSGGLLKVTYATLHSSVQSMEGPGVEGFSVTQSKYTPQDKSYKPAMLIGGKSYGVWGGINYENNGDAGGQPRLTADQFNNLPDYKTAQKILATVKPL